jgi:hypothetical protein
MTIVARIRQVDGITRVIYAQDARHAAIAREIIRRDPAMIGYLDGVDGIIITVREGDVS